MKKKKQTLLWEIIAPEGNRAYLFGTIHIVHPFTRYLCELIKPYIDACDLFAGETQLDELRKASSHHSYYMKDGKRIEDFISVKKFAKLRRQLLKSFNLDIMHYSNFHPILINQIISDQILEKSFLPNQDEYLWNYAKHQNKQLAGVETLDEHMKVLSLLNEKKQVSLFVKGITKIAKWKKVFDQMIKLYESQDVNRIAKFGAKQLGGMRKIMLYDRNILMANTMKTLMKNHRSFFTVGAAHLGAKKGIIALLKNDGYKVKAVLLENSQINLNEE